MEVDAAAMAEEPEPTSRKRRTTAADPRLSPEALRALVESEKASDRAADPPAEADQET